MRVANPLVHHKKPSMQQEFAMEFALPLFSEHDHRDLRKDPRRSVREDLALLIIVADEAGLGSGRVIETTTRGCGLRLTPPKRGQYLDLPPIIRLPRQFGHADKLMGVSELNRWSNTWGKVIYQTFRRSVDARF